MTTTNGSFQLRVLSGPPPLGPGAAPLERLIAYGRARAVFLVSRRDIARAALDGSQPTPAGARTPMSQVHIRMLLAQLSLGRADLDMLTIQLGAALDGPVLLYLSSGELADADEVEQRIGQAWQDLVRTRMPTMTRRRASRLRSRLSAIWPPARRHRARCGTGSRRQAGQAGSSGGRPKAANRPGSLKATMLATPSVVQVRTCTTCARCTPSRSRW